MQAINITDAPFSQYLAYIGQFGILSKDEIYHEFEQYEKTKDNKHIQKIILHHLRYVVHVAKKYTSYDGISIQDLVQEGNIGLMKGIKKFDYKKAKLDKTGLISFVINDIKGYMLEFVVKSIGLVKSITSKDHRKIFFNKRKFFSYPRPLTDITINQIHKEMNLIYKKSVREMEERLSIKNLSIHEDSSNDNDSFNNIDALQITSNTQNSLDDNYYNDKAYESKKALDVYLDVLDEREKDIISKRWLLDEKSTLHDLSLVYNVSKERIRQIEKMALLKMKKINVDE